jgi:iron complex outermembrane receptor protein
VTYASETGGFLPGSIRLPSYALVKTGAYVVRGPVRVDVNIDNLFNKLYFLANSDTDANANVLPGVGRTAHVKLSVTF